MYLRENHQVALYVACGDLNDMQIDNGVLKIYIEDSTMFTLLNDGKKEIHRALSWQGLDLDIQLYQKEKKLSKSEEDIQVLKDIFKDKLSINN